MRELQFAIRRLMKSPLQLAAGVLAFMLGIGVNTAMFSMADALLFRPLDLPELDRLLLFESFSRGSQLGLRDVSPADFHDFETSLKSFEALGLSEDWDATITRDGDPQRVVGSRVTANWFDLMRTTMLEGRGFRVGEDQPGNEHVAVIAHGLWAARYASDRKAVGKRIRLNNEDYTIVGVVKQTSRYPGYVEVFTPLVRGAGFTQRRADFDFMVMGRLKPGVSREAAQSEVSAVQAAIVGANKATHEGRSVRITPLGDRVAGTNDLARQYIMMLLYATAFTLLIACANVANLQLARVSARSREFAVMSALGAGNWPIIRQVFIESLLFSVGGAVVGAVASIWCVDLIKNLLPTDLWQFLPMWPYLSVNRTAVIYTSLLAVAAGILSAIAPAIQTLRTDAQETLHDGGRAMSAGKGRHWFRSAMVALQMTLALVLLIGAGLMVRSSQAQINRFGVKNPEQIATAKMYLPNHRYDTPEKRIEFSRQLTERLRAIPGAKSFALVNIMPYSDNGSSTTYTIEGEAVPPVNARPSALNEVVGPGYFDMQSIALIKGRLIDGQDQRGRTPACLIDEKLEERSFRRKNPLGQSITMNFGDQDVKCTIVGVVAANMHFPWELGPRPTIYRAMNQFGARLLSVMIRTDGPVESMQAALKQAVLAVDPDEPIADPYSYAQMIGNTLAGLRMVAIFMTAIGIVALVLACLGVYSVMSCIVTERTSEIGMRVAMGAQPRDIFRLLGFSGARMCGIGIGFGLVIGYALARLFSGLIFGIGPGDFWSLSSVSVLLGAVAALALYIPARRAIYMDPATALRHD